MDLVLLDILVFYTTEDGLEWSAEVINCPLCGEKHPLRYSGEYGTPLDRMPIGTEISWRDCTAANDPDPDPIDKCSGRYVLVEKEDNPAYIVEDSYRWPGGLRWRKEV